MSVLREQMQLLAKEIARARKERQEFLVNNKKRCAQLRAEVARTRNRVRRDLANQATHLTNQLHDFKRRNQRQIAGSMRSLHVTRLNTARRDHQNRQSTVIQNRRDIGSMLRQNALDRKRQLRETKRSCSATIQMVKQRVAGLRQETRHLTGTLAAQRSKVVSRPIAVGTRSPLTSASMLSRLPTTDAGRRPVAVASSLSRAHSMPTVSIDSRSNSVREARRPSALPLPPTR